MRETRSIDADGSALMRSRKISGGPLTMLPDGGWSRATVFQMVPFGVALISAIWGISWLDAGFDWWRSRSFVPVEGVVQAVDLEEHRGRRGRRTWRPSVVVTYRYGLHVGHVDRLYFGGAKNLPRDEAEATIKPYRPGETAWIWVNPQDPRQAIIERRFDSGDRLWLPALPLVAVGWFGVACAVWSPNRPRAAGGGKWEWTSRRVRVARLVIDGVICISIVGLYVWLGVSEGGWRGALCVGSGLLMFGTWMLPIAVSSAMRAFLPSVSATLVPVAGGWRLRYEISRGLVQPRRVAVTTMCERQWTTGRGKHKDEHHATPHIQTLASHDELPASGEVEVAVPDVLAGHQGERVRHFAVFRGGRPWWPDLHESLRLPMPADVARTVRGRRG